MKVTTKTVQERIVEFTLDEKECTEMIIAGLIAKGVITKEDGDNAKIEFNGLYSDFMFEDAHFRSVTRHEMS